MKKYIFTLFLGIVPLLVVVATSINESEAISIKPITSNLGYFEAEQPIYINGNNFGTEISKLKVILNGKSYSVESSYGNSLSFKLTSTVRSGQIYVTKQTEINEKSIILESNRIDLNLGEPQIHRLEAQDGIKPDGQITVNGINLSGATFWCGQKEITRLITQDTASTQDTKVVLMIPNVYLDCAIEATNHKFSFLTKDKIRVIPSFQPYSINLEANYIYVNGTGFSFYSNSLSKLRLAFEDGSSLSTPELVSDEKIRFKISQAIPNASNVSLEIDKLLLPPLTYNFNNDIAYVTEVSDLVSTSDGKTEFAITLNKSLQNMANSTVMMNGTKLTGTADGNVLKIKQSSVPANQVYKFWVEKDKFKGQIFLHTFEANFKPKIKQITALYDLNQSGGRIKIEGDNFYPADTLKIADVNGEKLNIKNLDSSSFEVVLPFGLKDGSLAINVSNAYGSANPVNISIPSSKSKIFYPKPNLEKIEYPEGPFFKKKIKLVGSGLQKTSAINLAGKSYVIETASDKEVIAMIPSDIEPTGKVSALVNYKELSNELNYEIYPLPESRIIKISYPLTNEISEINSTDATIYQDLFDFSILNNREVASLLIKWQINCEKDCLIGSPFMTYKLLDSDNKEIIKAKFIANLTENTVSLSLPTSAVDIKNTIYKVQVKPFSGVLKNEVRKIMLLSLTARDKSEKVIDQVSYDADNAKSVLIKANTTTSVFCKELKPDSKEETWQDCEDLRPRTGESAKEYPVDDTKTTTNSADSSEIVNKPNANAEVNVISPIVNNNKKFDFKDVNSKDWFHPYVKNLYELGIINGYADGYFKPADGINKAELLKMVLVARGEKWGTYVTASFNDTANHWSKDMAEYALEKNYIAGNRTNFYPLEKISRSQTMGVLCAMFPVIKTTSNQTTHFTDLKNHPKKDCIMAAYKLEIIKGASETTFKPDDLVTRAEFCKMLSKVIMLSIEAKGK